MEKDIKDLLKDYSKNNMPDLWDNIENKLDNKKSKKNKRIIAIAASIGIIITIGIIYNKFGLKGDMNNEMLSEDTNSNSEIASKIQLLDDLDLEKIMSDKIVLGRSLENSYAYDLRFINYETEAEAIVYGKVVNVKSYVKFGGMILSDITIEVINDYKKNIEEGDNIILGVSGGEISYYEFIEQADPGLVEKRGYNNIEDKTKNFIETREGLPVYRVGEYVLVYANSIANDEYYIKNPDESISYEYYPLKQLYADPNTREVFEYELDYENNKLIKKYIKSLDSLEN